jgi:acetyl-CoA carboxylase biotin carboxyl carrier protein
MPLSDDDIREILRLIDESDVEELRIETEAFSLHVLRDRATATDVSVEPLQTVGQAPAEEPPAEAREDRVATDEMQVISSPMLGTFYRAEAPGAPPFVGVGTRVEPDTVVCLIEVMKMMNSVPAGVVGTIVEVCAENAQLVEYGTALFQVQPDR